MTRDWKITIVIVVVLLSINTILTAFVGFELLQMQMQQQATGKKLDLVASQIQLDLKNYEDSAYNNKDVDRIAEQQLLATETTNLLIVRVVQALQTIYSK